MTINIEHAQLAVSKALDRIRWISLAANRNFITAAVTKYTR